MDEDSYFGEESEMDIYSTEEVEDLLESDEIGIGEEAFMKGYDEEIEGSKTATTCRFCRYELDMEDRICPVCGTSTSVGVEG